MPYINDTAKDDINALRIGPAFFQVEYHKPGFLTYAIYRLCVNYLGIAPSFADLSSVIGCIESAKLELYRRKVAPYEDEKIKQNGDVY